MSWQSTLTPEELSHLSWLKGRQRFHFNERKALLAKIYAMKRLGWERLREQSAVKEAAE